MRRRLGGHNASGVRRVTPGAAVTAILAVALFATPASASPAARPTLRSAIEEAGAHKGLGLDAPLPAWAKHIPIHFLSTWANRPNLPSRGVHGKLGFAGGTECTPPNCPNLRFNGGGVQTAPHIYAIFWGSNWEQEPWETLRSQIETMYRTVSGSAWQGILTQYFGSNGLIPTTNSLSTYVDTESTLPFSYEPITNTEEEVTRVINRMHWEKGGSNQFVVLPAPGTHYSGVKEYCGWHAVDDSSMDVPMSFIPYAGDEPFRGERYNCPSYDGSRNASNATSMIASHEYAESATDPYPATGWADVIGENATEVADLCAYYHDKELSAGVWVQELWDDRQERCSMSDPGPLPALHAITARATNATTSSATFHGTVNPGGLDTHYAFEYWIGEYGAHTKTPLTPEDVGSGTNTVEVSQSVIGLAHGELYNYRISAKNELGTTYGETFTFDTGPGAYTNYSEVESATEAVLHASIVPNGEDTHYYFEYGPTETYGTKVPIPPGTDVGSTGAAHVKQAVSHLEPNTLYHYRAVASNGDGTNSGQDLTFTTKPGVPIAISEPASYLDTLEPQLNGIVNPRNSSTTYQFEYGPAPGYGSSVPVTPASVGSGGAGVAVQASLGGLKRSTTYDYRVVATNAAGTSEGERQSFTTLPLCKGTEGKCDWSTSTTPKLAAPTETQLENVSCVSSTECWAVGQANGGWEGLIERWNGSEWTVDYGAADGGYLKGVSCLSSTFCMGVGALHGDTAYAVRKEGEGVTFSPVAIPTPVGASQVNLTSVSCTSTTACTAVGAYSATEGGFKILVERWNGTAWSIQTAPNPTEGNGRLAMLSVSCASSSWCIAVGKTTLSGEPFAERWNGSEWSSLTVPKPSGTVEGTLEKVSCISSTSCMAVGSTRESKGYEKTLAEQWNGAWSVVSTPSPSEAKGNVNLHGVSCLSASSCFAVGSYASKVEFGLTEEERSLAETFEGGKWTVQATPNPGEVEQSTLNAVSCVTLPSCMAVGSGSGPERPEAFSESWKSSWSIHSTPKLAAPTETQLENVSCVSSTECWAVGQANGGWEGLIERWNGSEWTVDYGAADGGYLKGVSCLSSTFCMGVGALHGDTAYAVRKEGEGVTFSPVAIPTPVGASQVNLTSVSCTSTTACTAVGAYSATEGGFKILVERWNGTAWSIQTAPNPTEGNGRLAMLSVSCASSSWCIAVGKTTLSGEPFAERWNGSEWSSLTVPKPSGTVEGTLEKVSCISSTSCMAVGSTRESKGYEKTLAEQWNGAWSVVSTPSPSEAKGNVNLHGVSCLSASSCFAVGSYASKVEFGLTEEERSLAETFEGGKWTVQATPNPSGKLVTLVGESCVSSITCVAIGKSDTEAFGERYE